MERSCAYDSVIVEMESMSMKPASRRKGTNSLRLLDESHASASGESTGGGRARAAEGVLGELLDSWSAIERESQNQIERRLTSVSNLFSKVYVGPAVTPFDTRHSPTVYFPFYFLFSNNISLFPFHEADARAAAM